MLRIRGPFSAVICLLSLIEAMHWCWSASGDDCSVFFVREVDNFRLFQSSFLSAGDDIMRLAAEMAERDTGRKHLPDEHGAPSLVHRKWSELEREINKRLREELLEMATLRIKVPDEARPPIDSLGRDLIRSHVMSQHPKAHKEDSESLTTPRLIVLLALILTTTAAHDCPRPATKNTAMRATRSIPHHAASLISLPTVLFCILLPLLLVPGGTLASPVTRRNVPPFRPASSFVSVPLPRGHGTAPRAYIYAPLGAPTECDLQCWLKQLVIHIPEESFYKSGVNGTFRNGVCTGLTISNLNSTLVPPLGASFAASGLHIQCNLDWHLSAFIFSASGSANASVGDSRLGATLELQRDKDGLAAAANVTSCGANIVVQSIEFKGDLSIFLDLFRKEISALISSTLDSIICTELKDLAKNNLTTVLQEVDGFIRPFLLPRDPVPLPIVPPGMANLKESPLLGMIDYILDDVVGADGILGLNKIMNALTNSTGELLISDIGFYLPISIPSLGTVTLGLENITLSGLNTWSVFDLLEPAGQQNLTSQTRLDNLTFSVAFSVNVTVNSTLGGTYLYEEAILVARLQNNTLQSDLVLAINETVLQALSNNQMVVPGCLISSLYDADMTKLDFAFILSQLQILATNGGTEEQLDNAINNVFAIMTSGYRVAIPAVFNGIIAGPVRMAVNEGFLELMEGNYTCTDPESPATFNEESTVMAFSGAGGVFAMLVAVVVLAFFISQITAALTASDEDPNAPLIVDESDLLDKKRKTSLMIKSDDENDHRINTSAKRGDEAERDTFSVDEMDEPRSKWLSSLLFSSRFPFPLRYGVLLLLFCNIALFISSNTSVGASVYVYITLGDQQTKLPSLFDFSLGNTVTDMWNAKVYALSLLIAIFSGAWPYLKLVMLVLCWVVPVSLLSRRRRERVLMALDALGKWSLIDAFVMTLMMVAFHFKIVPPVSSHTPPGTAAANAFVEPHWGFYSFLVATMLSLAITHIILAFHRRELPKEHTISSTSFFTLQKSDWEALHTHAFKSHRWLSRCSPFITVIIPALLLLSIGLLVAGAVLNSFQFQFKGAFQMLLNFLHQDSFQPYSLLTVGLDLPDSSQNPNGFGVRFIQVTWFCFAIALPLCYLLLLLTLWLTPMTPRLQRAVFVMTEVFNAWSALEVVVVSIIAALLELQQFSQFIIGDRCDLINPVLEKYFANYLDGDAKCFDVVATLDNGCWLLFSACVIYIAVGILVQLTCHKALEDREGRLAERDEAFNYLPININGAEYNYADRSPNHDH